MAHTHEFDCPICGAHLDSRKELGEHARKEHSHTASASAESGQSKRTDGLDGSGRPT